MGKNILIVDDSSMMRKMIAKTLREAGHTVAGEARSGAEAVARYRELRPDMVTMDITMRDMDGFAAAREILEADPAARIIFLSNLDEEKYSRDAEELGAVGYVNKHKSKDILALI
ncbi:MAG: response regulator [Desulfatibacillaceae bacterium]